MRNDKKLFFVTRKRKIAWLNVLFFMAIFIFCRSANAEKNCKNYMSEAKIIQDELIINVENIYPTLHGSDPFEILESTKEITTPCSLSFDFSAHGSSMRRSKPVALKSGKFNDGVSWIIFAYAEERLEPMSRMVIAMAVYDQDARQRETYELSYYMEWENALAMHSRIRGKRIDSCVQEIDFFSYKENGDIDDELDIPSRGECKYSTVMIKTTFDSY